MKKTIIYILLIAMLLLLASCSPVNNEVPGINSGAGISPSPKDEGITPKPDGTDGPDNTIPDSEPTPDGQPTKEPDDISPTPSGYNAQLELVRQGRVDGIKFGVGDSTEQIISEWGSPDESEYYLGGLYLSYDDQGVVFFTNADGEYGEITSHGEVVFIGISRDNKDLYGVRIGMTLDEIIEVLGNPTEKRSAEENDGSELSYGWTIDYTVGEYTASFQAETEDGQVYAVYLWNNKDFSN